MLERALETNYRMPPIDKKERIKEIEILLKTNLLKLEKEELRRERINLLIELKKDWKCVKEHNGKFY